MRVSDLSARVSATGSHFFTRSNMRFAGDRMSNYRVTGPVTLVTCSGDRPTCWELQRVRPVKHGLAASAYFDVLTFEQRHPRDNKLQSTHWDLSILSEYQGITRQWKHDTYHWRVTLKVGRRKMVTDYFAGLAHATDGKPNAPQLRDVLTCLQLDSQAGDMSLNDYVSEFGYEPGQRSKARATWQACVKQRARVARLLGDSFESFMSTPIEE